MEDQSTVIEFQYGDIDSDLAELQLSAQEPSGALFTDLGLVVEGGSPLGRLRLEPIQNASGAGIIVLRLSDGTSSISENVPLTIHEVNDPPVITLIKDIEIDQNQESVVVFGVSDPDDAPDRLLVDFASLNPTLIPDSQVELGGRGEERRLTIRPRLDQSGSSVLVVGVSDGREVDLTVFKVSVRSVDSGSNSELPVGARLLIEAIQGALIIRWDTAGVLQMSRHIDGPFESILGATSPFQLNPSGTEQMFFRVLTSP